MRVLVAVGSRHGSTRETGERIAEVLSQYELDVDVDNMADVRKISGYDAVVLGSALYMGKWITSARRFLDHFHQELLAVPIWVFSSGPVGGVAKAADVSPEQSATLETIGAVSGRVFAARPETRDLAERLLMKMIEAPKGDFRNGQEIDAWAQAIGQSLVDRVPERESA